VAQRPDALTLAAFLGFVVLAGGNGTAIAISLREVAPLWSAALRFLLAAGIFLGAALIARRPFPSGLTLRGSVLYGLFAFAGTFGFINLALQYVKPGLAQVIIAIVPLLTLALAVASRQERFRWPATVGAATTVAGVAYVFHEKLSSAVPVSGFLALLAGTLCIAMSGIVARRYPRADLVAGNAVAMGIAGVALLTASWVRGETWNIPSHASTWLSLGYLILAGTVVAFGLSLYVLHHWTASAASFQWVLLPLVAVPLSATVSGEAVTSSLLLGGAIILVGVYVGAFWARGKGAGKVSST